MSWFNNKYIKDKLLYFYGNKFINESHNSIFNISIFHKFFL